MIDPRTRTPEQWRAWSATHKLVGLALAIVLVLLWAFGHGPDATRCCGAPLAAAVPAAVPIPTPVVSAPVAPAPAPAAAAAAAALPAAKIFFAVAKSEAFAPDSDSLEPVVAYLKVHPDAKAVLSGYHDPSGSPVLNARLARQRASRVREALRSAGVAEAQIVMEKPRDATGSGSSAEARRVDVTVGP